MKEWAVWCLFTASFTPLTRQCYRSRSWSLLPTVDECVEIVNHRPLTRFRDEVCFHPVSCKGASESFKKENRIIILLRRKNICKGMYSYFSEYSFLLRLWRPLRCIISCTGNRWCHTVGTGLAACVSSESVGLSGWIYMHRPFSASIPRHSILPPLACRYWQRACDQVWGCTPTPLSQTGLDA